MASIAEQIQSIRAWVRIIRKDVCVRLLEHLELPAIGTSRKLKNKIRELITPENTEIIRRIITFKTQLDEERCRDIKKKEHEDMEEGLEEDEELESEEEEEPEERTDTHSGSNRQRPRSSSFKSAFSAESFQGFRRSELATIMDTVRKWGIKFSGNKRPTDAFDFLERVEECGRCYDIPLNQLPNVMPELLKDAPLDWYRSNKHNFKSWEEFKTCFSRFFLPRKRQSDYESEVEKCKQTKGQIIADYVIAIQSKMRWLKGYTEEDKLDRIYKNMLPEYKLYFRRKEASSVEELIELGIEYEDKIDEQRKQSHNKSSSPPSKKPEQPKSFSLLNNYDRNECCWRCGQRGHRRQNCRNRSILFCSYCGKTNTKSVDCPCSKPTRTAPTGKRPNQPENSIPTANIATNDSRPYTDVFIKGRKFRALIDCGANTSFIGRNALEWVISQRFPSHYIGSSTTLANGTKGNSPVSYRVTMIANNLEIIQDFLTLEGLTEDVLLGMSTLNQLGFTISFSPTATLEFNKTETKCNTLSSNCFPRNYQGHGKVNQLFTEYLPKFQSWEPDNSITKHISRRIHEVPLKQKHFPRKPVRYKIINRQVDELHSKEGKLNVITDALSREPLTSPIDDIDDDTFCNLLNYEPCNWINSMVDKIRKDPKQYPDYRIVDGQLFRHLGSHKLSESEWKLCVPKNLRYQVMNECHGKVTTGHLGIRKTIARAYSNYYWPGISRDIGNFVRQCKSCLEYKVPQDKPAGLMHTTICSRPWQIVTSDFIGPLPRSTRGFKYIVVFQDKFTKFTEFVAIREATTATLLNAFRDRIIARVGFPEIFISDNGSQFTSRRFKEYLTENGIKHQLIPPYKPQCNSTERVNRVIKTMIARYITKNDHKTWDQNLAELQLALNTCEHESTGFTPAFANFGWTPSNPTDIIENSERKQIENPLETKQRLDRLKEIRSYMVQNLSKARYNQARYYNLRHKDWTPLIGSFVYKKEHHLSDASKAFNSKLAPKYTGPFEVLNFVSPTVIEVSEVGTKQISRCHLSDIKPVNITK